MNITRYTDYALRTLLFLGAREGESCTIAEIADSHGISRNHLMKVVQDLSHRGFVQATRGRNGGLRLARDPETINIGRLVHELEGESGLPECFRDTDGCRITPACELRHAFDEAQRAFYRALEGYTLAALLPAGKARRMLKLLAVHSGDG